MLLFIDDWIINLDYSLDNSAARIERAQQPRPTRQPKFMISCVPLATCHQWKPAPTAGARNKCAETMSLQILNTNREEGGCVDEAGWDYNSKRYLLLKRTR